MGLSGSAQFQVDATMRIVFGVDGSGFFLDPGAFKLDLSNLKILDGPDALGQVGFLGVTVSDATLAFDAGVHIIVSMKDPGPDPATGIDDGKVRATELTVYDPSAVFAMSVIPGTTNHDVVLTAHFDAGAVIPVADAPFTIGGADLQLTWPNATQPTNVTIAAAPGSLGGGLLEQFLSFNTHDFINGLASAADAVQALTGQDLLATKLPLVNTTLGDLINANPAPLTFSGTQGQVADVSEPTSDGITERFVVTLAAGLTPLPRQGVKVGDWVLYKTANATGDKLWGTIDALGDGWFSVTYAAALNQVPDRTSPSFEIRRTSKLGDLLRDLIGEGIDTPATSVKLDASQFTQVSSSAGRSVFTLNSGVTPLARQGVANGDQVVLQTMKGGWITGTIGNVSDGLFGFDLLLISWGDGSAVPTAGRNLVIVGADNAGKLHIRIFDARGSITNTDETLLPGTQAALILELKGALPGLLSPNVLTAADKAKWLDKVSSIVGQTPGFSVSYSRRTRTWFPISASRSRSSSLRRRVFRARQPCGCLPCKTWCAASVPSWATRPTRSIRPSRCRSTRPPSS